MGMQSTRIFNNNQNHLQSNWLALLYFGFFFARKATKTEKKIHNEQSRPARLFICVYGSMFYLFVVAIVFEENKKKFCCCHKNFNQHKNLI
jgi:hypothetical protein